MRPVIAAVVGAAISGGVDTPLRVAAEFANGDNEGVHCAA